MSGLAEACPMADPHGGSCERHASPMWVRGPIVTCCRRQPARRVSGYKDRYACGKPPLRTCTCRQSNIAALQATGGNVNAAVERLLGGA